MSFESPLATQSGFAAGLLAGQLPLLQGLKSWNSSQPERRFAIYRNNVVSGLIAALESRFPATQKIVGAEFFKAMASTYIIKHPPRSPVLLEFGNDFPEFVSGFEAASGLPYLPDVIRLEIARGLAYHAPDMVPLDLQKLSDLESTRLHELRFAFHPSMTVVRSAYPIVKIWAMNGGDLPVEPIEEWEAEDAITTRPEMDVLVHALPKGTAEFLRVLLTGAPLEAAFNEAICATNDFDLTAALACLFRMGAVTSVGPA